jgi:hypothetical protein
MSVQVSLYDALVSIDVPAEKARAVADAMERDMSAALATKNDMQLLRQEFSQLRQDVSRDAEQLRRDVGREIEPFRQEVRRDMGQLRQEVHLEIGLVRKDMERLRSSMTVRLGSMQVVAVGLLFAALKLT